MNILYFRTPFPLNFPNSEPFIILSCDIFRHHNAASIKTLLIFWPFFVCLFFFLLYAKYTQYIVDPYAKYCRQTDKKAFHMKYFTVFFSQFSSIT